MCVVYVSHMCVFMDVCVYVDTGWRAIPGVSSSVTIYLVF